MGQLARVAYRIHSGSNQMLLENFLELLIGGENIFEKLVLMIGPSIWTGNLLRMHRHVEEQKIECQNI